eukprot:CAMPEP_0172302508 /NCGR_PEP_ID=MMETSP1058-20130122/4213_1 /TAXON_ID=83371 /ORGANISM="Detonula confervacea, Strain CCMP 353" /LENGTH=67 /DNA_ID=CAMNT_0013013021 /DNA_START=69 /DNA_END=268 /DNA_ORIENTATION=+
MTGPASTILPPQHNSIFYFVNINHAHSIMKTSAVLVAAFAGSATAFAPSTALYRNTALNLKVGETAP